jgi:hypothetical protein
VVVAGEEVAEEDVVDVVDVAPFRPPVVEVVVP